jgi:hypothetical protein
MRLVDFLIELLHAQAKTLQRLAFLFGEDWLLEMLEEAGENMIEEGHPLKIEFDWFEKSDISDPSSAYLQLEGAVAEHSLSAALQFHLWAYPYYRLLIESSFHLKSKIRILHDAKSFELVDEAIKQSKKWISGLPIPADLVPQAEKIAEIPWVRFRANILKKIGKSPVMSI